MASSAELRPSEPDRDGGGLRGDRPLSAVSARGGDAPRAGRGRVAEVEVSGRVASVGGHLSVAREAVWNASEPARGQMVRARHADHHTASLVFTRDDREGHGGLFSGDQPQNWWAHDLRKWMSWGQIGEYLNARPEVFVVEVLVRPGRSITHRGCELDGACDKGELEHGWL